MKTALLPLLAALLLTAACQQKNEPVPTPDPGTTFICFPTSVTSANDEGLNEVFTYSPQGDLQQREYFTRTDTVHHFELYLNDIRDYVGIVEFRDHSPNSPKLSYHSISYMHYDNLPVYKNHYPAEPVNSMVMLGSEVYTYNAQYELDEQQIHKNYRLAKKYKFTNANNIMRHVEVYDGPTGEKLRDMDLEYDDKVFPHAQNVPYKKILVGLGFPHFHNLKEVMVHDAAGELLEEESYRNTFTYNEQGYPLTITQTYLNGYSNTFTYTYNCIDISK
ncbi:hypothetical protein [Pontibacter anaerobius]|uniref:YD repeat-containing protein n=1 Tax=Pontibacter anaerobius TaxID=2993940 RepID=A0ABT3RI84_9BACT|nr:hypothetical protein [Pontibacter anaerobius]MCX2741524.1 hypothetical protein [Pontibacter anaerobius]